MGPELPIYTKRPQRGAGHKRWRRNAALLAHTRTTTRRQNDILAPFRRPGITHDRVSRERRQSTGICTRSRRRDEPVESFYERSRFVRRDADPRRSRPLRSGSEAVERRVTQGEDPRRPSPGSLADSAKPDRRGRCPRPGPRRQEAITAAPKTG